MKRITSIVIEVLEDPTADLSYLGEYSDTAGPNAIRRPAQHSATYIYFNPTLSAEETGNPGSPGQDYKRFESYGNEWVMLYIRAVAHVQTSMDGQYWKMHEIASGGLGSVESDSEASYLADVGNEQVDELALDLLEFGFTIEQIAEARKNLTTKQVGSIPVSEQFSRIG